ncbi:hypothetical protein TVAG_348140 [Trichomonas vaginalis G3]|uniref:DUF3447 domain-containing protein n=1 Tax=Trichomonas vaginalis (strain ATCC PRA-98 / G3) TaxID=412133 RepID=A2DSV5_TRIV3|nr:protein of unknown function (DUF3447) [Trichomonas vaginalis G3]EAY16504.1 hypothetical protein TVAG_348140 [Trichomonas vaginalis G3]KAI5488029.1 protein of unknown function (DUF3447) [Trichomonas vaginalis G3]|eukprot:XP_001328727.1 hypothetical protein [Trichomonas vaginalis G3]
MNDDKESFILFTEREGFDENQKIMSELYPFSKAAHSLLELCCYHGAVDCFKILRSKYNSEITIICLRFSFLSGNPEIMSECLKKHKPDQDCMFFAICSHNIDFVTFLVNEYKLEIDLEQCVKLHNLQAFLVYLDLTNQINTCFVYSPSFHIPSLCECFLNNGADINSKEYYGKTALHYAAESKEIVELLLLHKIDINTKDMFGRSAFNYAAAKDCKEVIQILISNGADEKINGYIRPIARDFAHHGMNL